MERQRDGGTERLSLIIAKGHLSPCPSVSLSLCLSVSLSLCLCGNLRAPLEQITSFDQGAHLSVGDAPVEHPEAAVRVNIFEPAIAGLPDNRFYAGGDELRAFDFVVLDVYDSDAEADVRIEVAKHFQLIVAPPRKFEHEVIGAQFVQKGDEVAPEPPLGGLPAVVAEADVYGGLIGHAVERMVDRLGRPAGVLGVSGDVGLVQLDHVGLDSP